MNSAPASEAAREVVHDTILRTLGYSERSMRPWEVSDLTLLRPTELGPFQSPRPLHLGFGPIHITASPCRPFTLALCHQCRESFGIKAIRAEPLVTSLGRPARDPWHSRHTAVKKIKEVVEGVVSDVFNLRRKSGCYGV